MISQEYMYKFRFMIHELYDKDVVLGDFCGNVLEISESNPNIEKVEVDMLNHYLAYVLKEIRMKDFEDIKQKVMNEIRNFVMKNRSQIPPFPESTLSSRDLFDDFLGTELIADTCIIGNKIIFSL